jgi:hypothetical protein
MAIFNSVEARRNRGGTGGLFGPLARTGAAVRAAMLRSKNRLPEGLAYREQRRRNREERASAGPGSPPHFALAGGIVALNPQLEARPEWVWMSQMPVQSDGPFLASEGEPDQTVHRSGSSPHRLGSASNRRSLWFLRS